MNKKKRNTLLGTLLIIFGLVCTGISIFNYIKPEITVDIIKIKEDSIYACQQHALSNGFSTSRMGDEIIATSKNNESFLKNPMPFVYKSTIVIEKCENMHLTYYCAGGDCEQEFIFKMKFPIQRQK